MCILCFTESEDRTYCFHCAGSLHNWDEYDEPWVEHAHWFPKCKFVLKTRGQSFIDEARVKKHEDLARTQEVSIASANASIDRSVVQVEGGNISSTYLPFVPMFPYSQSWVVREVTFLVKSVPRILIDHNGTVWEIE
jgi:hypothetical protein